MANIIKSNFYKLFRNKTFIVCSLILGASAILFAVLSYFLQSSEAATDGASMLTKSISNTSWVSFIFIIITASFITADYADGTLKNVFSKGISRTKYHIANSITVTFTGFIFFVLYVIVSVIIATVKAGFGSLTNGGYFAGQLTAQILLFAASMVLVSFTSVVTKKSLPAILLYLAITFLPTVLTAAASAIKLNINFNYIGFKYYIGELSNNTVNIPLLLGGIAVAAAYIVLSVLGGSLVLKKQDIK